MNLVNIPIAFWAGLISFFSPCVLPLIPAYILYITGKSSDEDAYKSKKLIVTRTLGFVTGFSIIFILLGVAATVVGSFLNANLTIFKRISGVIIIIFGLYMLNVINLEFLNISFKLKAPKIKGFFSALLMGMAFSIGWTPCVGVVLGSILLLAASQNTITQGIIMLTSYSVGLAVPFIVASLILDKFEKNISKIEKSSVYISKIGGVLMIILGILVALDKLSVILYIFG